MTATYLQLAQILFVLSLMVAGGAGLAAAATPGTLRAWQRSRTVREAILVAGVGIVGAGAFLAAAQSTGTDQSGLGDAFLGTLLMSGTMAMFGTLAVAAEEAASPPASRAEGLLPKEAAFLFLAMVAWSALTFYPLLHLLGAKPRPDLPLQSITIDRPWEFLAMACIALTAAVLEEVIFRGALLGALLRLTRSATAAVLLSSVLFALGHAAYLDVPGIKELQIFGLGVLLGWARMKGGLVWAMRLHLAFNALMVLLSLLGE